LSIEQKQGTTLGVLALSSTEIVQKKVKLFGFAVVGVAAVIHGFQVVLELRIAKNAFPFEADLFPGRLQLFLLFAFLLTAAGLARIRTLAGLICSMLGMIGVFVAHLFWHSYSDELLYWVNQDGLYERHPDLRPPSLFGLVGAHWWDFVFLALFIVLFVWEVKLLVSRLHKRNHQEP
jgi:hypothetical protein